MIFLNVSEPILIQRMLITNFEYRFQFMFMFIFSIQLYEEGIEQRKIIKKEVINGNLISM